MTKETLAAQLNGTQYGQEAAAFDEEKLAAAGLAVAYMGLNEHSEDSLKLAGAINAGLDCNSGGTFYLAKKDGLWTAIHEFQFNTIRPFLEPSQYHPVTVFWRPKDDKGEPVATWIISAGEGVDEVSFDIMKADKLYCRGIAFSVQGL